MLSELREYRQSKRELRGRIKHEKREMELKYIAGVSNVHQEKTVRKYLKFRIIKIAISATVIVLTVIFNPDVVVDVIKSASSLFTGG